MSIFYEDSSSAPVYLEVSLACPAGRLTDFNELLQRGFQLGVELGASVRSVLCGQLGVSDEYLDHRINTIFLDGKSVDDVDSSTIGEGSVLALSASMPGFVGAALRKGGRYAAMRREISHVEQEGLRSGAKGRFTLKLYNHVAKELGPFFLESGVWINAVELVIFLAGRPPRFWPGLSTRESDWREISSDHWLRRLDWQERRALVHLTVKGVE
jgi:hypothetical protein